MKKKNLMFAVLAVACVGHVSIAQSKENIYKKGRIDFNKNGIMDVYENPRETTEKRVQNLVSFMNLDEKTCQMATLYEFLQGIDEMPKDLSNINSVQIINYSAGYICNC